MVHDIRLSTRRLLEIENLKVKLVLKDKKISICQFELILSSVFVRNVRYQLIMLHVFFN